DENSQQELIKKIIDNKEVPLTTIQEFCSVVIPEFTSKYVKDDRIWSCWFSEFYNKEVTYNLKNRRTSRIGFRHSRWLYYDKEPGRWIFENWYENDKVDPDRALSGRIDSLAEDGHIVKVSKYPLGAFDLAELIG